MLRSPVPVREGDRERAPRPEPAKRRRAGALDPHLGPLAPRAHAPSLDARTHHETLLQEQVSWDLSGCRLEREFDDGDVRCVKQAAQGWYDLAVAGAAAELRPLLAPGVTYSQVTETLQKQLFKGLETAHKEETVLKKALPYVEPRVSRMEQHEHVSFDLFDLLVRKLTHDKHFRKMVLQTSEKWKKGKMHRRMPKVLKDIMDGTKARFHPELLRKALPGEENHVRVAVLPWLDDVEVRQAHQDPRAQRARDAPSPLTCLCVSYRIAAGEEPSWSIPDNS
jgi:hypothetical protein